MMISYYIHTNIHISHIMSCLVLSHLVISIVLNLTTRWCMSLRSFFVGISSSGAISRLEKDVYRQLLLHIHIKPPQACVGSSMFAEEFSWECFGEWFHEHTTMEVDWTSDSWDVILNSKFPEFGPSFLPYQDFIMRKFCEHRKKDKTFGCLKFYIWHQYSSQTKFVVKVSKF